MGGRPPAGSDSPAGTDSPAGNDAAPEPPAGVREEAERLVATMLAAASLALRAAQGSEHGWRPGPGFATGTADCCICPLCRAIAALRDPSPELAERLATSAGDLAVAVAGVLRACAGAFGHGRGEDGAGGVWDAATRAPGGGTGEGPAG
jgi:hypothetical protein